MDVFCKEVIPFAPLTMREIRFWLRIMKEHAMFIHLGLSKEQIELKEEAQQFFCVFEDLKKRGCNIKCGEEFSCFAEMVICSVKNFFTFKRHVLHLLIECKLCGGCLYPLLLDHMSREAVYFLKLMQKLCAGEMQHRIEAIVSENVFWLRIMADHLKFFRGSMDPAERQLIDQSQVLSTQFDQLSLQARDYDSMLWHFHPTDDFTRFEKNVVQTTTCLRDFNVAAETMFKECAALTTIQPLVADHSRREVEHFLKILELIREDLMSCDESFIRCGDFEE